jgi:glycosyltransferase involved in cell wall biosynthesis
MSQSPSAPVEISVVLPAKNEADNLKTLLPEIQAVLPDAEIIVVSDGSTDRTETLCQELGVRCLAHPYSMGNGAAVKAGARAAHGRTLVFMDADGQHDPADIPRLLASLNGGYHMVVGARQADTHASLGRRLANGVYNQVATRMVGHVVADLTSGFRAAEASKFREFLRLLPNGFSYPTTITMAFFRNGYSVGYVPIRARERGGVSHIRPLRDGFRFIIIIFRVATLYSPLKMFLPISVVFFALGLLRYGYTYFAHGQFSNMSALLFSTSTIVFLIGLVSEQITMLLFSTKSTSPDS